MSLKYVSAYEGYDVLIHEEVVRVPIEEAERLLVEG
jgi:hypothetical protein